MGCVFQDTMVHIGVMKDITCIISECTQNLWFISVYLMMNTCCEASLTFPVRHGEREEKISVACKISMMFDCI